MENGLKIQERGHPKCATPDKNGKNQFKAIHRFYAPMIFEGVVYPAKLTGKEFPRKTE